MVYFPTIDDLPGDGGGGGDGVCVRTGSSNVALTTGVSREEEEETSPEGRTNAGTCASNGRTRSPDG